MTIRIQYVFVKEGGKEIDGASGEALGHARQSVEVRVVGALGARSRDCTTDSVLERVVTVLEAARARIVRAVKSEMILAYWHIRWEIIESARDVASSAPSRARRSWDALDGARRALQAGVLDGESSEFPPVLPDGRRTPIHHEPGDVSADLLGGTAAASASRGFSSRLTWTRPILMKVENPAGPACALSKLHGQLGRRSIGGSVD
jgi:hypothetical protein